MSKSRQITLRVQSSEGTKRLDVYLTDTVSQLFEKIYEAFQLSSFGFSLYKQRNHNDELFSSRSKTVGESDLGHGDIVYLAPVNGAMVFNNPSYNISDNNFPEIGKYFSPR
jgi:nuclear protein localization family protein 4